MRRQQTIRRDVLAGLAAAVLLAAPGEAAGQTLGTRGFFGVDGGYQAATTDFRDQVEFTLHAEDSEIDASYEVAPGPLVDVRGGLRLWRGLAVGVAVTRYSEAGTASVTAGLPHPFFFRTHRQVSGEDATFRREEIGAHLQVAWIAPVGDRLTVTVFGGPSHFTVRQDMVERVEFSESYPYDTATFTGLRKKRAKDSAVGFNAGLDVGYFFSRYVGLGGLVRFSRATVGLTAIDDDTVSIDTGGLHATGGLRFRF